MTALSRAQADVETFWDGGIFEIFPIRVHGGCHLRTSHHFPDKTISRENSHKTKGSLFIAFMLNCGVVMFLNGLIC